MLTGFLNFFDIFSVFFLQMGVYTLVAIQSKPKIIRGVGCRDGAGQRL